MRETITYPILDMNDGSRKLLRVIKGSTLENVIKLTTKVRDVTGIPPDVRLVVTTGVDGKITIKQHGT